jgi:hypothetical protein
VVNGRGDNVESAAAGQALGIEVTNSIQLLAS